jgi:beta-barrel assembly-enhancing protease
MLRIAYFPILFFLALAFSACSHSEIAQDGGDLTRAEVELLSRNISGKIEEAFPLVKHRLVNRYVNSLGQGMIARNSDMPPLPYEFRVIRSSEVLIFSLPGGLVYLSLGLLRAVEFEGQLAAALAHELAHQQLGHSLILWRRKVNANRGTPYVLQFQGEFSSEFFGAEGVLRLDSQMEEEADRLGPAILYRSGFDTRMYSSFLQLLQTYETKKPALVAKLSQLHPALSARQVWARESTLKIPPRQGQSVSSSTFMQIKSILKEAERQGG